MTKKYLIYGILAVLLIMNRSSFSMHTLIFRGTQVASAGYCIGKGLKDAYDRHKTLQIDWVDCGFTLIPDQEPIHALVNAEMKRLNVSKKSLYYRSMWASSGNALFVPQDFCDKLKHYRKMKDDLDDLLKKQACWEEDVEARKKFMLLGSIFSSIPKHNQHDFDCLNFEINYLQNALVDKDKVEAFGEIDFGHELGHVVNQDSKKRTYALALIPMMIQAACSSVTYKFNKLCGIKAPSTVLRAAFRSSLAAGSIPLKIAFSYLGFMSYARYTEKRADQYACVHAKGKLQLEAMRNDFKNDETNFNEMILFNPSLLADNFKGIFEGNDKVAKKISEQLHDLTTQSSKLENENSKTKAFIVEMQKKGLIRAAHFMFDPEHPYFGDRVDMIQGYINERDKKHADDMVIEQK